MNTSTVTALINSSADDGTSSNLLRYTLAALQNDRKQQIDVGVAPGSPVSIDISSINSFSVLAIISDQPIDISMYNDGSVDVYSGVYTKMRMFVFNPEQVVTQLKLQSTVSANCQIIILGSGL